MTKITADKMASDYMKLRHTIKEKEDEIKKLKEIQTKISDLYRKEIE